MKIPKFIESFFFSAISLTNTQKFASRFLKAESMMPAIFIPRYSTGAHISTELAKQLYSQVPNLDSKDWTNFWITVGDRFASEKNHRAAAMSYILGSFPREPYPWKKLINERKRESFQLWCREKKVPYIERDVKTSEGSVRYYYFNPGSLENATDGKQYPVTIFINGLEGSAEEFAFALENHTQNGIGFALLSCPGSPDYEMPMTENSDQIIRTVVDDLIQMNWVDASRLGMVGFSFGAYWTLICTKLDSRLKFGLCNGIPYRHTFSPDIGFGLNPVIAYSLLCVFRVKHPIMLIGILKKLIAKADALLLRPSGPILAINGDHDTIVDTRDTKIVGMAPGNRLILLRNDDHCGLFHFKRMVNIITSWARMNLNKAEKQSAESIEKSLSS